MVKRITSIDEQAAKKIAIRFLQQHHSAIISCTSLEGDYWLVDAKVGFFPEQIKKIRIDANDGKIIECN